MPRRTPAPCTVEGCTRNRKYRDVCNTHYERARRGSEPLVMAAPLVEYAMRHGLEIPRIEDQAMVNLHTADAVCCNEFGVHPYAVYGDDYFNAA